MIFLKKYTIIFGIWRKKCVAYIGRTYQAVDHITEKKFDDSLAQYIHSFPSI